MLLAIKHAESSANWHESCNTWRTGRHEAWDHELINPFKTPPVQVMSVVDYFMGKTMSNLQCKLLQIIRWMCSKFPSAVDVDGYPDCSSSVTLV
jgi:hypothetical protein